MRLCPLNKPPPLPTHQAHNLRPRQTLPPPRSPGPGLCNLCLRQNCYRATARQRPRWRPCALTKCVRAGGNRGKNSQQNFCASTSAAKTGPYHLAPCSGLPQVRRPFPIARTLQTSTVRHGISTLSWRRNSPRVPLRMTHCYRPQLSMLTTLISRAKRWSC